MCYGVSYSCDVWCVNTDLNTTKLAEKTIQSVREAGDGCSITCAEGIRDSGWATTMNVPAPSDPITGVLGQINPWLALLFLIWIIVVGVCIYYMIKQVGEKK